MKKVFIGIGGNIGNVHENIINAIEQIRKKIGRVIRESSLYKTAPWGYKDQNDFLNKVICVSTELKPLEVLNNLLKIERDMGRNRHADNKNAARIIDLDILFYEDEIISYDNLVIPHSRLHLRNFVLTPLSEIAPDLQHPVLLKTIKNILEENPDNSAVNKL